MVMSLTRQRRMGMCINVAEEIIQTLKSSDNEATAAPYWLIIDPRVIEGFFVGCEGGQRPDINEIINHMVTGITGPFFSRKDAEEHLNNKRHRFSSMAVVYCHSGHSSWKYREFCNDIGVGTNWVKRGII